MNKTRIMILEDDARASYTLESSINENDHCCVVCVCESCADALIQFPLYHPDLLFVDITLPDGSGIDLMRKLREQKSQCHFIMTTAVRDTKTVEQAIQLGAIDYLVKPIRMSRVLQALADYGQYKATLMNRKTVNQEEIDQLFGRSANIFPRHTPKGIDNTTLLTLKQTITQLDKREFSAEEIGHIMHFSRVTARRYLEYLESEGILSLVLNYNTGGRPKRIYKMQN